MVSTCEFAFTVFQTNLGLSKYQKYVRQSKINNKIYGLFVLIESNILLLNHDVKISLNVPEKNPVMFMNT